MIPTIDAPVAPPTGPRYYRSFASYEIPFRPIEPVAFADTEGLRSFYVAYHDRSGRVVRFDKLRLVRVEKEPRTCALPTAREPGSAVYFAAVSNPSGGEPQLGGQLAYPETEAHDEFFAGVVGPSGKDCKVTRLRREVAFTDTYAYWPGGRLRSRVKSGPEQDAVGEYYDADGNKVEDRVSYLWEELIQGGIAHTEAGDYAAAREALGYALHAAQREESLQGIAAALNQLARIDRAEGRDADAVEKCERALPFARAVNKANGELSSRENRERGCDANHTD